MFEKQQVKIKRKKIMAKTTVDIQTIIKNYISETFMYDQPQAELTTDTPLIEGGLIDSMGIFRLITFLEEAFGFTIAPEQILLESFETITAITNLVESSLSQVKD